MRYVLIAAATGVALVATPAAAQFGIYVGPAEPYGYYDNYAYGTYGGPPAYGYYGAPRVYGAAPVYGYEPTYAPSYGYTTTYTYRPPANRQYYGGPKWDW